MATTKRAQHGARKRDDVEARIEAGSFELLDGQRIALIATLVTTLLLFLRGANDSFSTPKVAAVFVGTIAVLAFGAARVVRTRALLVPAGPTPWIFGVFVAGIAVAAVANERGMVAALGPYSRYEGYLPYLCYVAIALVIVRVADGAWLLSLVRWLTGTLGAIVLYGLVQVIGKDPFHWTDAGGHHAFSTLGQENFAGGVVAILIPVAVCSAVLSARSRRVLIAHLVLLAGAVVIVWRANSFQGPVATIPGLAPLAMVFLGPQLVRVARLRFAGRTAVVVTVAAAVVAAALVVGPNLLRGSWSQLRTGTDERRYLWQAAWTLFTRHPILGNGFGAYAREFSQVRPAAHAIQYGPVWSDAPHSVPLGLLVTGGIVLFAAYLAVVGYTAWCLFQGMRRLQGPERTLLAGVGGAWIAYLVQSLVSIDVPPVAVLQWVMVGAIVYLGGRRDLRIVGPASADPGSVGPATRVVEVAVALGALVFAWFALLPLRADLSSGFARDAHARLNTTEEVTDARSAADMAPWEPTYHSQLATAYERVDRFKQAFDAGVRAAGLDTGRPISALAVANLAQQMNDTSAARHWFDVAMSRDPYFGGGYDSAGKFYGRLGDRNRSVALLEKATRYSPQNAQFWRDYGEALAGNNQLQQAVDALQHSLTLEPSNQVPQLIDEIKKAMATGHG